MRKLYYSPYYYTIEGTKMSTQNTKMPHKSGAMRSIKMDLKVVASGDDIEKAIALELQRDDSDDDEAKLKEALNHDQE